MIKKTKFSLLKFVLCIGALFVVGAVYAIGSGAVQIGGYALIPSVHDVDLRIVNADIINPITRATDVRSQYGERIHIVGTPTVDMPDQYGIDLFLYFLQLGDTRTISFQVNSVQSGDAFVNSWSIDLSNMPTYNGQPVIQVTTPVDIATGQSIVGQTFAPGLSPKIFQFEAKWPTSALVMPGGTNNFTATLSFIAV